MDIYNHTVVLETNTLSDFLVGLCRTWLDDNGVISEHKVKTLRF